MEENSVVVTCHKKQYGYLYTTGVNAAPNHRQAPRLGVTNASCWGGWRHVVFQ